MTSKAPIPEDPVRRDLRQALGAAPPGGISAMIRSILLSKSSRVCPHAVRKDIRVPPRLGRIGLRLPAPVFLQHQLANQVGSARLQEADAVIDNLPAAIILAHYPQLGQ
jgi:hypothetical protein